MIIRNTIRKSKNKLDLKGYSQRRKKLNEPA